MTFPAGFFLAYSVVVHVVDTSGRIILDQPPRERRDGDIKENAIEKLTECQESVIAKVAIATGKVDRFNNPMTDVGCCVLKTELLVARPLTNE